MGIFSALLAKTDNSHLVQAIKDGAFLVDVRSPGEFACGSAKGAMNIPLDQLPAQLSKFRGRKNIIVFCRSGSRSGQAKTILEKNGIQNVVNGGTWQNVRQLINQ